MILLKILLLLLLLLFDIIICDIIQLINFIRGQQLELLLIIFFCKKTRIQYAICLYNWLIPIVQNNNKKMKIRKIL